MKPSSEIKPALTPDEWCERKVLLPDTDADEIRAPRGGGLVVARGEGYDDDDNYTGFEAYIARRHAVAALALYDQPFGFTHKDVAALRRSIDDGERWYTARGWSTYGTDEHLQRARSVANRIAALLPPEVVDEVG